MAFHMADILLASSVSMSRPIPVRTKNKHSSCQSNRSINKQPKQNEIILGGKPTSWRESVDGCFSVAQQLSANKDNRIKSADGLDDPDFTFVTRLRLFSC